jgi:hypothetical protein
MAMLNTQRVYHGNQSIVAIENPPFSSLIFPAFFLPEIVQPRLMTPEGKSTHIPLSSLFKHIKLYTTICNHIKPYKTIIKPYLVGGFNHLEKYESVGMIISTIWKKCLKPPTSYKIPHNTI